MAPCLGSRGASNEPPLDPPLCLRQKKTCYLGRQYSVAKAVLTVYLTSLVHVAGVKLGGNLGEKIALGTKILP